MLLSGEVAAAIGVQVESSDVQPLIPNAREVGMAALRARGFYPINHTVVVRNDRLAEDPGLAADIFNVFGEAKRGYVERLRAGTIEEPSADDQFFRRVMEITGDPLPYGIEPNRAMLDAIVRYASEQGILTGPTRVEDLFPPSTHSLTA
jgi:4,5-dihydroxyphthalate decarboxylase